MDTSYGMGQGEGEGNDPMDTQDESDKNKAKVIATAECFEDDEDGDELLGSLVIDESQGQVQQMQEQQPEEEKSAPTGNNEVISLSQLFGQRNWSNDDMEMMDTQFNTQESMMNSQELNQILGGLGSQSQGYGGTQGAQGEIQINSFTNIVVKPDFTHPPTGTFQASTQQNPYDYALQMIFPENSDRQKVEYYAPLSPPSPTPSVESSPERSQIAASGSPTQHQDQEYATLTMVNENDTEPISEQREMIPQDARIVIYDQNGVPTEQFYDPVTQSFQPKTETRTFDELQIQATVELQANPTYNTRAQTRRVLDKNYSTHDPLPFECGICHERFAKKLVLNNHTEKRHGIKYVFTERGKKVKLVRMPEEHLEGEKLDPCVEMLLKSNKESSKNVLGVAELPTEASAANADFGVPNPTAHELDPTDVIKHKGNEEFGAGILIPTLKFFAVKTALEKGQTPFVAYQPTDQSGNYLLAIETLSKDEQLLVPATLDDIENAPDVEAETIQDITVSEESQRPGPSSSLAPLPVKIPKKNYSNIAIVGLAKQILDASTGNVKMEISPPPQVIVNPKLIGFELFTKTLIPTKPKHLRCLAIPPKPTLLAAMEVQEAQSNVTSAVGPKRTYTRRTQGRRNKALDQEVKNLRQEFRMRTARLKMEANKKSYDENKENADDALAGVGSGESRRNKSKKNTDPDWGKTTQEVDSSEDEEVEEDYILPDSPSEVGPANGKDDEILYLPRRGRPRKLDFE